MTAENIFAGDTIPNKITRMNEVTKKTLDKATEHAKFQKGVGKTVDVITSLGSVVGTALQANPVAGLAVSDKFPDKILKL